MRSRVRIKTNKTQNATFAWPLLGKCVFWSTGSYFHEKANSDRKRGSPRGEKIHFCIEEERKYRAKEILMKEEEIEKADCRPRWAGASEPRCTSSQAGLLTFGHLSPSPIGNLDPLDDRGSAGTGASSAIVFWGWSGGVSRYRVWLPSARWLRTAWFKSDKISKKGEKILANVNAAKREVKNAPFLATKTFLVATFLNALVVGIDCSVRKESLLESCWKPKLWNVSLSSAHAAHARKWNAQC